MWILRDVHVRRWEKRNRSNVYWRIMKVCVSSIQDGVLKNFTFLGIEKIWTISSLYIIFLIFDFLFLWKKSDDFYPKIFQYSQTKICPRWLNVFPRDKMFQYPHILYYSPKMRNSIQHTEKEKNLPTFWKGHYNNSSIFVDLKQKDTNQESCSNSLQLKVNNTYCFLLFK